MFEEEEPELSKLEAKFAPLSKVAASQVQRTEKIISVTLNSRGLIGEGEINDPSLQIYKIIDPSDKNKMDTNKVPVSPDEVQFEAQGESFLLKFSRQPLLYQLQLQAKDATGKVMGRKLLMQVDKMGIIRVEMTTGVAPSKLLSGQWRQSDQGEFIKWLENFPFPTSDPSSRPDGVNGVLAVKDGQLLWGKPNGELSLGRIEKKGIEWKASYYQHHQYNNDRLPTDVAFHGNFIFLTTFGNGLYTGQLHEGSIDWGRRYPRASGISDFLTKVSMEEDTIAVGSYNNGLALGTISGGDHISWTADYNREVLRETKGIKIDGDHIRQLSFQGKRLFWSSGEDDKHLFWSSGEDGFLFATLTQEGFLGEVRHIPLRFTPDPELYLNISSILFQGERLFVGSNNGQLAQYELQQDQLNLISAQYYKNDPRMTDHPVSSIVIDGDLVLMGSYGGGMLLGHKDGDKIRWRKRYTQERREKMGSDVVWKVLRYQDKILVAHSQGLSVGTTRPWQHWYLVSP